jgi:hypothetical protein
MKPTLQAFAKISVACSMRANIIPSDSCSFSLIEVTFEEDRDHCRGSRIIIVLEAAG